MIAIDRVADSLAGIRSVRIDPDRCLPRLAVRAGCDRCAAICPEGAIDLAALSVQECSTCGLCAAVCQGDAIRLDNPSDQELLQRFAALGRRAAHLTLTCAQAAPGAAGALQVGCLGRLTPELLLAAAACGFEQVDLVADPERCRSCRCAAGLALWEGAIGTASALLAQVGHPCQLRVTAQAGAPGKRRAGEGVTAPLFEERRAFLLSALGLLRQVLPVAAAPEPVGEHVARPSRRREILRWALAQLGVKRLAGLTWGEHGLTLAGACHTCGVCERLCPNGALHLSAEGLAVDLGRCHTCGLCTKVCPVSALDFGPPTSLRAVASGESHPLGRADRVGCERCGEAAAVVLPLAPTEGFTCLPCTLRGDREVVLR